MFTCRSRFVGGFARDVIWFGSMFIWGPQCAPGFLRNIEIRELVLFFLVRIKVLGGINMAYLSGQSTTAALRMLMTRSISGGYIHQNKTKWVLLHLLSIS